MEEIIRFVTLAQTDRFTLTDLCEQCGISRKTGYKHLARYAEGGLKALAPRSHRPHTSPQRTEVRTGEIGVRTGRIGNKLSGVMGYT